MAACTTRLRLVLVDNKAIDEADAQALGRARHPALVGDKACRWCLGPIADQVAGEIRAALRRSAPRRRRRPASRCVAGRSRDAPRFLAALGGRDNVVDFGTSREPPADPHGTARRVDESALSKLGIRGIARSAADSIQLLVAGPAENWAEPLRRLPLA